MLFDRHDLFILFVSRFSAVSNIFGHSLFLRSLVFVLNFRAFSLFLIFLRLEFSLSEASAALAARAGAADAAPPKKSARNFAEGGKEKARKFLKNKTQMHSLVVLKSVEICPMRTLKNPTVILITS
ncbi:hypothetical protein A3D84_01270 [Candidatus Woesebacteria bacterium RIFCSPHIGHO2_02_FULL_42_20]|nr:MAG: hypothetical protein A2W15_05485 [Candidatus Woesebacteria bacterium RBG_16_41_13]OGM30906.1 MAG: hypothetical protein A2873_03800 [Candidatus Woesebacteria bacterium RIFCSPHIGHO2_01_FULL_42_80]OGM35875.1 MAG: hypothetical protein A3D84_01270 [Candidatus Woesebacteria bacterium RIFCSPHIGHO2_02_FULL_42_20]OGM66125.1 MAG: hypothetical protein A2969_04125 [Candidatus Woesebacteria bacterium RIFCSPLOWO2_01_FULL_42_67]OGM69249.1 MAG: hypothetical protein A3I55_03920 [Candidatus Woesebacteria